MTAFTHPIMNEIDALAPLLQDVGQRLENDPTDWMPLWENELLRAIILMEVPEPYNPMPNCNGFLGEAPNSYAALVATAERMARHDASCILAMPTPTMAGFAIRELGNQSQIETYFARYSGPPKRSFFGITEPEVGSDATHGSSKITLHNGRARLEAHKKLVGGAAQADMGLIFAHDSRHNAHKLVFVGPNDLKEMQITRLKTNGLAGADLTEIQVSNLEVTDEMILGHGLDRGLRDGFFAMNRVFERYRPIVATLAIGTARGLIDQLNKLGARDPRLDIFKARHAVFLQRLQNASDAYDAGKPKMQTISSLKLDATNFLDDVVSLVFSILPSQDIFSSPQLLRKCRDAKAFEYMEGTSNIHTLQAYRSFATEVKSCQFT